MVAHTPDQVVPQEEGKISVPGFEEHEISHLSNGQRKKLAEERNAGFKASGSYAEAFEHNKRQVAEAQAREEAQTGNRPLLDPEAITAQRLAEHRMAETRAREQQAKNILANATKEAADQLETIHGREGVSLTIAGDVSQVALDVARERVSQAEDAGLGSGQATHGHPANSKEQAEAAFANTEKELSDRVESGTAEQPLQGHGQNNVTLRRVPVFDGNGEFMGTQVGDIFEPDPDYTGNEVPPLPEHIAQNGTDPNVGVVETENQQPAANPPPSIMGLDNPQGVDYRGPGQDQNSESPADNGQPQQTSEPDAAQIAAGLGTDEGETRRRGGRNKQKPASSNAGPVGTGPKSE